MIIIFFLCMSFIIPSEMNIHPKMMLLITLEMIIITMFLFSTIAFLFWPWPRCPGHPHLVEQHEWPSPRPPVHGPDPGPLPGPREGTPQPDPPIRCLLPERSLQSGPRPHSLGPVSTFHLLQPGRSIGSRPKIKFSFSGATFSHPID